MLDHAALNRRLSAYIAALEKEHQTGIAREDAYRPALKLLLESVDDQITAVNDPSHIEVGAPDFIVVRDGVQIAYLETKDVTVDIARLEQSDQIERYRALNNLIVTNYLDFRWYVEGQLQLAASLGHFEGRRIVRNPDGIDQVTGMLLDFMALGIPHIARARDLAAQMARVARELRYLIHRNYDQEGQADTLHLQLAAFQQQLIPDLSPDQFADMYAQTVAYGLFAAAVRWHTEGQNTPFARATAWDQIPRTNPFLRRLFFQIQGGDFPDRVAWLVDHLATILAHADLSEILRDFGRATRQDDPVVHFYEDFLAAYDPQLRERRGVYYTPEPVVSYIVRSVDWLLKHRFGRPDGLADPHTLILDPAAGTGTFLYFVVQHIYQTLIEEQGQAGAWDEYVRDHVLPRIFGFELLMAPYAVAHMKLGIQLQETGYQFSGDQRLGIYLTNTLEEAIEKSESLPFMNFISEEGNEAARVKRGKPIMVVLGNPPYSGHSANRSRDDQGNLTWVGRLLQDYYQVDGQPLGERNPKWLQDDYVKFIRFGQWRIEQTGEGILAFVTNHGYLDNPTFRGMRQQLIQTFDEIYILDLHGNARRREVAPDGGPDDNVFDIQQGVSISIFIKQGHEVRQKTGIYHGELWGDRQHKYMTLFNLNLETTNMTKLAPESPLYLLAIIP